MADIENDEGAGTALLPGAHRVVRTLDASEGPFAGTLVTYGDRVAVRVDAAALGGWVGWRFSGAEHVASPLDVCRRRDGHDALLPWCTERVSAFLIRRSAAGAILTPGESSTLVISLLRGLDEVGEGIEGVRTGEWWLTDGGRPLFVFGRGTDAAAGVGELFERVAEHSADKALRRALGSIVEGLRKAAPQPRVAPRLIAGWEEELLALAAPQPLERGTHAPERARTVARTVASRDLLPTGRQRLRADRAHGRDRRGIAGRGTVVVDLVRVCLEAMRAGVHSVGRALAGRRAPRMPDGVPSVRGAQTPGDARRPARRRSVIVAVTAAAAVLTAGLLWPGGGVPGEASDAPEGAPATAHSSVGEDPTTRRDPPTTDLPHDTDAVRVPPGATEDQADPEAAIPALLDAISACRTHDDSACPESVAPDSTGVVDALASVDPDSSETDLVDEYGDVAVIRLTIGQPEEKTEAASGTPVALMVVLIRTAEKWLVRDVYDVADQPG